MKSAVFKKNKGRYDVLLLTHPQWILASVSVLLSAGSQWGHTCHPPHTMDKYCIQPYLSLVYQYHLFIAIFRPPETQSLSTAPTLNMANIALSLIQWWGPQSMTAASCATVRSSLLLKARLLIGNHVVCFHGRQFYVNMLIYTLSVGKTCTFSLQ